MERIGRKNNPKAVFWLMKWSPLLLIRFCYTDTKQPLIEAIEQIGVTGFKVNHRGCGSEQYPPDMMLALLVYSYVTGRFGSRTIEAATYTDVAIRYICGGHAHPDHTVICAFRKDNKEVFEETFTKILVLARQMKKLKGVGGPAATGQRFMRTQASIRRSVTSGPRKS